MKRNQLVLGFTLVGLILSLTISLQEQSAIAQGAKNTAEAPAISPKPAPDANNLSPRISFEKTVCDLGEVGQSTKNTCEFKFTNTGSADGGLKIGKIKRTCGCTAG